MKKLSLFLILVGCLASTSVLAFQSFIVQGIKIYGLHRISEGAVLDDLPVRVGQTITDSKATEAIQALYKTGFFKDVVLSRSGNILVVRVVERPTISRLTLTGIKDKDKVKKLLKEAGLGEGQLYDPAVVLQAQKELERYYLSKGRYGVTIDPKITEEANGALVAVELCIFEGDVAKIQEIKIIGNRVFTEKELLSQMQLSKTNWLSWFKSDDKYNKEKLNADLEILRSYYMDRGYITFQIESSQVSLSPDKKHIFITIHISEGDKYTYGDSNLTGQFVVPKSKLMPLMAPLKEGETFSRRTLIEVQEAIKDRLGDEGYILAEIEQRHVVDDVNKRVNVAFHIVAGRRMMVRRIDIRGNATTKDVVLRREIPQMEGTWISNVLVKGGKEKILRRGYGKEIEIETPEVPGSPDQIDVVYNMEEARMGQIGAGIGYSGTEKLMFNFSISQENFFGTGKTVDFTFDNSKASTNYAVGYQDPYFTVDGIGMGASAFYNKTNLSKTTDLSNYKTDTLGGDVRFLFPIDVYEFFRIGFGYDNTTLKLDRRTLIAQEILAFSNKYGTKFTEFTVGLGWTYDSLNQRMFPTKGTSQSAGVKFVIPGANQQYYKLSYEINKYIPVSDNERWVVGLMGNLGYGNGYGRTPTMPFYRNFTAGGTRFVRGFEEASLGPKDSLGRAFGGNLLVAATASFIFPNPIKPAIKSLRTALFLDAGQVYDTRYRTKIVNGMTVKRNPRGGLRYSVGVSVTWHTPLGGAPISFSLAKPLNRKPGDEVRAFNFMMGTQF